MPPRARSQDKAKDTPGPYAGQASIRKAYEALGVQHFYASHGAQYTNPHEQQISAAISQLLDTTPAAVWLGLSDLEVEAAAHGDGNGEEDDDSGDDGGGGEHAGSSRCDEFGITFAVGSNNCSSSHTASTVCDRLPLAAAAVPPPPLGSTAIPEAVPPACRRHLTLTAATAEAAALAALAVTSGLQPPVPLRVLDLACGSGEATAALTDWNLNHPLPSSPAPPAKGGGPQPIAAATVVTGAAQLAAASSARNRQKQQQQQQSKGYGKTAAAIVVLPYDLHITACDPYTGAAYLQRTGRSAHSWSFEDIADGCLSDWEPPAKPPESPQRTTDSPQHQLGPRSLLPPFDLAICSFRYLSSADLVAFFGTILDTAFVHFGAYLFLGWFEYQFLMQYHHVGAAGRAILEHFRFTKRFLDDLAALNNPFLIQFLPLAFQHPSGLHGLYPDVLAQHHPHLPAGHFPFLDILLVHQPVTVGGRLYSRFATRLYDKREQPAFMRVRLSRFVHASSNVNEAAQRNIFTSQFQRLRFIILDADNFVQEVARVIHTLAANGYLLHRLLAASDDLCARHPTAYWLHRRRPHIGP